MSQLAESNHTSDIAEIPSLPPLPIEIPPPLQASASMPNLTPLSQPPPSLYQAQYLQYMQYMQYMQYAQTYAATAANAAASYPVPGVVPKPQTGYFSNVAAAASSYASSRQAMMVTGSNSSASSSNQTKQTDQPSQESSVNNKSSIKINLKFNQNNSKSPLMSTEIDSATTSPTVTTPIPPPVRKSRFNNSLSNVTAEQNAFKAKDQVNIMKPNTAIETQKSPVTNEAKEAADAKAASDIVFDIHKWPVALKTYCTKVYQNYANVFGLSEDQVTKYLQKRITDTFKIKPDLNIDWESEPVPSIEDIRKEAPLSQQQIMQQKKQEAAVLAAKARANQILANKQLQLQQKQEQRKLTANNIFTNEESKIPKKRKNRSQSRSSSRSNASSDDSSGSSRSNEAPKKFNNKKKTSSTPDFISLNNSTSKTKNSYKLFMNGKKKMLKNIQINNLNGKSTYSFENQQGKNNRIENRLKNNLNFSNENCSESESGSDDETEFKTAHKRQLSVKLANRQERFKKTNSTSERMCFIEDQSVSHKNLRNIFNLSKDDTDFADSTNQECIGQCTDLEKEYLRLTGPPEAHLVRPQHVLEKSLEYVLNKYEHTKNYRYICEQLKSIRQDLSVQWIQNEFTIEVYETHARIAIKNKDRDEFNQCQSKLKSLYALMETRGNKENNGPNSKIFENSAEFVGYRLIYSMLTKSHTDSNQVIKEIKVKYSGHAYLEHLLSLRNALHLNNYVKFFRLYAKSNEMSKCLIDLFIERVRKLALKIIIKSYRPSIKLESLSEMLAYESVQKCREDLIKYQLTIQSVPIVPATNASNSLESSEKSKSSPNLTTALIKNKNLPEKSQFEEVLDCKSCTLQGL